MDMHVCVHAHTHTHTHTHTFHNESSNSPHKQCVSLFSMSLPELALLSLLVLVTPTG
ncbi:hypothetical protein ACRRTK_010481 [Alexandromys fortis]